MLQSRFSTPHESVGFLLWKTANLLQRRHVSQLKALQLTPAQFAVLATLVDLTGKKEPQTATAIGQRTGLDKMFISDMIRSLEKKNSSI